MYIPNCVHIYIYVYLHTYVYIDTHRNFVVCVLITVEVMTLGSALHTSSLEQRRLESEYLEVDGPSKLLLTGALTLPVLRATPIRRLSGILKAEAVEPIRTSRVPRMIYQ